MVPSHGDALSAALSKLSVILVGEASLRDTLHQVAVVGQETIAGADMCGMTLLDDGRPTTAVWTSDNALDVDEIQYRRNEGPCLQAYRDKRVYRVDSNLTDTRWPGFSKEAADAGVLSSLSLPLVVADRGIGALNYYARAESAYADEDESMGTTFATAAAVLLANSDAYWGAQTLATQLDQAMQSRAVIEQAKGIVMSQSGITPDEAFQLLVRASQRENRKLRDIAAEIVERSQQVRPTTTD
jgi:GAF domain-containing protein